MDRPANSRIEVRVWDAPTRLFHWVLVAAVGLSLFTGYLAPAWWLGIHRLAGYAICALLLFRIVWWFYGFEYSRFTSLIGAIRHLREFLRGLIKLTPSHHAGHNPAGSVMIIALIAVLVLLSASGLIAEGGQEKLGILAGLLSFAIGNVARNIHELLAVVLMAMIGIHIAGVAIETRLLKTPLVRGMINGYLPLPPSIVPAHPKVSRPRSAATVMAVVTLTVAAASLWLLSLPPTGMAAMPENQTFKSECSDCHYAFHPSLLPRASWAKIMASLDDHFGEDASLDPAKALEIATYLDAFASEAWDTEAANLLRRVSAAEPMRITASPYWIRKHRNIAPAVFDSPAVKTATDCVACHRDAASGRFDDQAIAIPQPDQQGKPP